MSLQELLWKCKEELKLRNVFERALEESGIKKEATFYSLRYSLATHLSENVKDAR